VRGFVPIITVLLLLGGPGWIAAEDRPDLSGTWKLDQAKAEPGQANKDFVLVFEQKEQNIQYKETRGPNPKGDVSSFSCDVLGKQCDMQDGGEKAKISVYYSGSTMVMMKVRKNGSVEKRQLTESASGDSLVMEIIHVVPSGATEKFAFSKVP
jgi:hypothetical protein